MKGGKERGGREEDADREEAQDEVVEEEEEEEALTIKVGCAVPRLPVSPNNESTSSLRRFSAGASANDAETVSRWESLCCCCGCCGHLKCNTHQGEK